MQSTWKPTLAGILTIIGGIMLPFPGTYILPDFNTFNIEPSAPAPPAITEPDQAPVIEIPPTQMITPTWIYAIIGISVTLSVIAIIGGIMALRRRKRGLALTGSILCLLAFPIGTALGIVAIVLLHKGKSEFTW